MRPCEVIFRGVLYRFEVSVGSPPDGDPVADRWGYVGTVRLHDPCGPSWEVLRQFGHDRTRLYARLFRMASSRCVEFLVDLAAGQAEGAPHAEAPAEEATVVVPKPFLHIQVREARHRGTPTWTISHRVKKEKLDFNPLGAAKTYISLQEADGYEVALVEYRPEILYPAPEEMRKPGGLWPFHVLDLEVVRQDYPECVVAANRGHAGRRSGVSRAN